MTDALGFAAVEAIRNGDLDRHLDAIEQAVRARIRLRLIGTDEKAPPRTPEMVHNHQHWVWMNNTNTWEVRGTGVIG